MPSSPTRSTLARRRTSRLRATRTAALTAVCALAGLAPGVLAQTGFAGAAAPEAFVHESWTVADGLPVNSVSSLLQDQEGYLWIATLDGLVRFDGVRFTVFNTGNSPGLPSNRVVRLIEARDGALWLVTEQGKLVRFQGGVFTHVGPDRTLTHGDGPLLEDAGGTIWVGTESGLSMVQDDGLVDVAAQAIRDPVGAIAQRRDGSIWVGTMAGGLYRIHGEGAVAIGPGTGPVGEHVFALYEDRVGALWIGATEGAWRYTDTFELVLQTFTPFRFRTSPLTGELWVVSASRVFRYGAEGMRLVLENRNSPLAGDRLLVDGEGQMLYASGPELYREEQRIHTLPPDAGEGHTDLQTIAVVLQDREGSLWLGTRGAGLHRLKPADFSVYSEPEGLSHRNVYSVFEDRSGALWVGTLEGGTNRIDGGRATPMTPADGDPRTVYAFLQDRTGRLWMGGGSGIHVCEEPGRRCAQVAEDPTRSLAVRAIHEEPDGTLYFGSEAGLFRLEDGRWTRFSVADGAPAAPVRAFVRTRDGALWMATNGAGLARYESGHFTRIGTAQGLPLELVRALHEDADGWLWVGTEGRGLARLDPQEWGPGLGGGRIVVYRAEHGLFDEGIHQVLEDEFGRLWMSSNRGIFWVRRQELLDFADGRVPRISSIGYTERDGLRNREANGGSQSAGVRASDGRLWFATQDGVAVVDPARIQGNPLPPRVVIEQVTAGGRLMPVPPGGSLRMGVEERDLEIDFTALSFLAPTNVRFRYRLEGYDRDWVEAGGRRTAYYTRVPPGEYTFHVVASSSDGVWSEEGAAVRLELAPRFHETGVFRLLFALALTLVIVGLGRLRVRALRARSRELEQLVAWRTAELEREKDVTARQARALQELDRAKSRFFANVSHEFRTPLTLTIGPLEDLHASLNGNGGERNGTRRHVEMALRNARRLLRLVNQILDVARLEAGQMKLRARHQDLAGFARGVAAAFAPVAERKGIDFEVVDANGPVLVWFDADAMEKVLGNLLSNAFKFTPDGGRITLEVEASAGEARLRVRDSGPGIAPEHVPHVFDRFFQVDETTTRSQPGTGIGLALAKELSELHGGTIAVENGEVAGACFTVTLPLGQGHLRRDQLAPGAELEGASVTESDDPAVSGELGPEPAAMGEDPEEDPEDAEGGDGDAEGADAEGDGEDVTTLLVVDDSADLRAYVRAHFAARYRVVEAADGAEGIALARTLLPDLVISDVMMPGTDGYELCRTLKGDLETDFIPVVLLTARAATDDRVAGLVDGADDYLVKPFEMRELSARVENLIASRRHLRERFAGEGVPVPPTEAVAVATPTEPALAPADLDFVERLRATVEAQVGDPEFSVAGLARALFVDRTHLFRRTRDLMGESPSELIRRTRLERAALLLREGAGGVGEIAYAVGFNSVSHFSRCFRERYGSSPSEYREGSPAAR
ncbi:MAG: response regulator [Gemmatimonadales bacterium]|nr:MAG: response regulator [Gemmatimonadales bacterium]